MPMKIVRPGLKEAYGKLLYYIAKLTQLSECEVVIEPRFEAVEVKGVENIDIIGAISSMSELSTNIIQCSFHAEEWSNSLQSLTDLLIIMIAFEGWELEDIQFSSLSQADKEAAAE